MRVSIATLDGLAYEGEASSLSAPTTSGEITVLDHHHPLMTLLASGSLAVTDAESGEKKSFAVSSGALEVGADNTVRILAHV